MRNYARVRCCRRKVALSVSNLHPAPRLAIAPRKAAIAAAAFACAGAVPADTGAMVAVAGLAIAGIIKEIAVFVLMIADFAPVIADMEAVQALSRRRNSASIARMDELHPSIAGCQVALRPYRHHLVRSAYST